MAAPPALAQQYWTNPGAQGQTAPGCNPDVEKAQQSRGTVMTANDVNVTEEHADKNDTTLAITCASLTHGYAADANGGGSVFSGDFKTNRPSGNGGGLFYNGQGLNATIGDALRLFYDEQYSAFSDAEAFENDMAIPGGIGRIPDVYATNYYMVPERQDLGMFNGTLDCAGHSLMWDENIKKRGVRRNAPSATLGDILFGNIPSGAGVMQGDYSGGDNGYQSNWDTENNSDNNMPNFKNDLDNSVQGANAPWMPVFQPTDTYCAMLGVALGGGVTCP